MLRDVPKFLAEAAVRKRIRRWLWVLISGLCLVPLPLSGEESAAPPNAASLLATVGQEYDRQARPLIQRFCLECHATSKKEGDLDLERFAALTDVRKGTRDWQKVAEMLDQGEMPPKDAKRQPTADQRRALREWVRQYLHAEGHARAGDPGPVVLRRLNNAEYTYTVRDLTGVAALEPAREFPVDSAAGEGFTNTGAALVMSPALFSKYLDAAKGIAAHAVLLPDGIRFSPKITRRDWTDAIVTRIRDFMQSVLSETTRVCSGPTGAAFRRTAVGGNAS